MYESDKNPPITFFQKTPGGIDWSLNVCDGTNHFERTGPRGIQQGFDDDLFILIETGQCDGSCQEHQIEFSNRLRQFAWTCQARRAIAMTMKKKPKAA
ncbi:MAG: hypothetical protein K9L85_02120 [Candidatus Peribacteraceae bacterium]|nr:hypothetical protein [Candidatus Peribacteraceae bacterium]